MIAVCLDWNCIIELEEERKYAPVLQQIREWSKQGKIELCIAGSSRLENHRSKNRGVYNEDEWTEKQGTLQLVTAVAPMVLIAGMRRFLGLPPA